MSAETKPGICPLPETPVDALKKLVREHVLVDGKTFIIERPDESDRLLDHPFVTDAFARDEYLPYWADLWPAARMLAKVIIREPWTPAVEALEIGCGLGLPGVAALSMGLRVTFSDYDATALRFASRNAQLNGFDDFKILHMDWRQPPAGLGFPVLLASDLVYEHRNVAPLVALIKQVLLPDGICLLTDQDRVHSQTLRDALLAGGLQFTTQVARAGEPGGRRVKGSLYRIKHAPVG
jgi:predicted nicotinamide N-methyase